MFVNSLHKLSLQKKKWSRRSGHVGQIFSKCTRQSGGAWNVKICTCGTVGRTVGSTTSVQQTSSSVNNSCLAPFPIGALLCVKTSNMGFLQKKPQTKHPPKKKKRGQKRQQPPPPPAPKKPKSTKLQTSVLVYSTDTEITKYKNIKATQFVP